MAARVLSYSGRRSHARKILENLPRTVRNFDMFCVNTFSENTNLFFITTFEWVFFVDRANKT